MPLRFAQVVRLFCAIVIALRLIRPSYNARGHRNEHRQNRRGEKCVSPADQPQRVIQRLHGKQIVHFLHIGKTGGSAIRHAL